VVCASRGKPLIYSVSFSWDGSVRNSMALQFWLTSYQTLLFILQSNVVLRSPTTFYFSFTIFLKANHEQSNGCAVSTFIPISATIYFSYMTTHLLLFRLFRIDLLWGLVFLSYEFEHPLVLVVHYGMTIISILLSCCWTLFSQFCYY
jgi:hypothetical protein